MLNLFTSDKCDYNVVLVSRERTFVKKTLYKWIILISDVSTRDCNVVNAL